MANDIVSYQPEIVQPAQLADTSSIDDAMAQQFGTLAQTAKTEFDTVEQIPRVEAAQKEALTPGNIPGLGMVAGAGAHFGPAFSPGQAQAEQLGLQMNKIALQSGMTTHMSQLAQNTIQSVGINNETIPTFTSNAQAYVKGIQDSSDPSISANIQLAGLRSGAVETASLSRQVQNYNSGQNAQLFNQNDQQSGNRVIALGPQSGGFPDPDSSKNNVVQAEIMANTQTRRDAAQTALALKEITPIGYTKKIHQINVDAYTAYAEGHYATLLNQDATNLSKAVAAGEPTPPSSAGAYYQSLKTGPNPFPQVWNDKNDIPTVLTRLDNMRATQDNQIIQGVADTKIQSKNLVASAGNGNIPDSQGVSQVLDNSTSNQNQRFIRNLTLSTLSGNTANNLNNESLVSQNKANAQLKGGNYQPLTGNMTEKGWGDNDIKDASLMTLAKNQSNLALWKSNPALSTENTQAWENTRNNTITNEVQDGTEQNLIKNYSTNIPLPNSPVFTTPGPEKLLSSNASDALDKVLTSKDNFQRNVKGVSDPQLYSTEAYQSVAQAFTAMQPSQRAAAIDNYIKFYGDHAQQFLSGLYKNGVSPATQFYGMAKSLGTLNPLDTSSLNDAASTPLSDLKSLVKGNVSVIDKAVSLDMQPHTASILGDPTVTNVENIKFAGNLVSAAQRTAYQLMAEENITPQEAATKATAFITGGFKYNNTYRIANQINGQPTPGLSLIKQYLDIRQANARDSIFANIDKSNQSVADKATAKANWTNRYIDGGHWAALRDNDNMVLVDPNKIPLRNADGSLFKTSISALSNDPSVQSQLPQVQTSFEAEQLQQAGL